MQAGLSVLLVVIYNCSDQVLATRERRQAKSREKAVRSVRETAQAREKWKSARDVAKKHALGLQTQLSRTFSRRKSTKQPDSRGLFQAKPGSDAALPPFAPGGSGKPEQSSSAAKGNKKDKNNLTQMMHAIEADPESNEGFNLEIGDKNLKKNMPRGKQLHTHSQIFKYAYNQIEKEKALQEKNKNLTFSGVISMATDIDIRKRPTIEVAFKDLTLTLKGKKKHLLRCVTGKISPGRVSAVMGPSGAGKTTFLSALAGKVTGCTMSGMILINGKVESIHSYKRIIGFVPQDDIVHGNLTVEENLWFSARCRYLVILAVCSLNILYGIMDCVRQRIEEKHVFYFDWLLVSLVLSGIIFTRIKLVRITDPSRVYYFDVCHCKIISKSVASRMRSPSLCSFSWLYSTWILRCTFVIFVQPPVISLLLASILAN